MRPDKTNVWPSDWRVFLTKMAWGLAVLLLASGLITWIAANWPGWGPTARLALAQGALALSALLALLMRRRQGGWSHDLGVPAALTGLAAVGCGGLFALIGQVYQTGADPWQLFALWAALILPWVLTVRSVFLSVLWLVVLNAALYLWIDTQVTYWAGGAETWPIWLGLGLNALLLLAAETVWRPRHDPWRLLARSAAVAVAGFIALLAIEQGLWPALGLYLALYGLYRLWRSDLFMSAVALLGAYGVVFALVLDYLVDSSFLLALAVLIALGLGLLRVLQLHLAHWRNARPAAGGDEADPAGDEHYPWYLRVVKLVLYIVLPLLVLLYLALSLDLSIEAMGVVGAVMALASPLLYVRAQTLARRDLVGGWVLCAVLLLSAPLIDGYYPWPREVSALLGVLVAGLLYRQARGQFVLRFLLAAWALLGLQYLFIDRLLERMQEPPGWLLSLPGLLFFLLALWLGHRSFKQADRGSFWMPLFWALMLHGLWRSVAWEAVRWGLSAYLERPPLNVVDVLVSILPLFILGLYWRDWRERPRVGLVAFAGLAALCAAWLPYPPVALALSWILAAYAWRYLSLLAVGVALGLFSLWRLYYLLDISLLDKAWLLLATGAGCVVLAGLGRERRLDGQAVAPASPPRGVVAGVLAGLALVLGVANAVIVQKERILSGGRPVVLELAPVDPRSLMQGDYMALNFAISQQVSALIGGLPLEQEQAVRQAGRLQASLQPDERGVAQLRGVHVDMDGESRWLGVEQQAEPQDAVRLSLKRRQSGWTPGTDAWFFAEGTGERFDKARYGEFAVSDGGQALLRRMLDAQLQEIP